MMQLNYMLVWYLSLGIPGNGVSLLPNLCSVALLSDIKRLK